MQLLNVVAAAEKLSISPWTIRRYIAEGKLRPVRIGRRVLLQESELERFVGESVRDNADRPADRANDLAGAQ